MIAAFHYRSSVETVTKALNLPLDLKGHLCYTEKNLDGAWTISRD